MKRRWTSVLAWGLWILDVAVVVTLLSRGDTESRIWGSLASALFIFVFATTGALVASRVPGNPVGWLLCLSAFAFSVGGVCVEVSESAVGDGEPGAVVTTAAVVGTFVWILGFGPAATFLLLLFPDGHLPSRRWRPVGWLSGVAIFSTATGLILTPGTIEDTPVTNPLGVPGGFAEGLATVGLVLMFVSILVCCASLVARYRSAATHQRQQLKWLAWSLPMVLAGLGASVLVESTQSGGAAIDVANALTALGVTVVPVAIAVAILRSRLYDIDVVIKRTLVYGVLSALLVGTYLGSVLVFQLVLDPLTGQSDLAVAASTLAVAALFRPLRTRVQAVVDRRFFRSRYDAARTLTDFSGRLRHELDLETLGIDLRGVVRETMQPAHVTLWMREQP